MMPRAITNFVPLRQSRENDLKRRRTNSNRYLGHTVTEFSVKASANVFNEEKETDPKRIKARQTQIDYGKNTSGYDNYIKQIPKHKRTKGCPMTPDIHQQCSKRSWDGQIRSWRRTLHKYDPPQCEDEIVIHLSEEEESNTPREKSDESESRKEKRKSPPSDEEYEEYEIKYEKTSYVISYQ